VTVVEKPVPPIERSAPRRTLLVLLSLVVGGIVGLSGALVRWSIKETEEEPAGRRKLEEIREALVPERWR
jgi:LPS O-antigen subunit length determinant protein (WzzB/FepE family)